MRSIFLDTYVHTLQSSFQCLDTAENTTKKKICMVYLSDQL